MSNIKKTRRKDSVLMKRIRSQACLVCMLKMNIDVHHIKSRGSGGHDVEYNLAPLCREHHTEIHKLGNNRFAEKYKRFSIWLIRNGWELNLNSMKWIRPIGGVI